MSELKRISSFGSGGRDGWYFAPKHVAQRKVKINLKIAIKGHFGDFLKGNQSCRLFIAESWEPGVMQLENVSVEK